jgi:membrane-bound lytic murein transglycosylase D
MKLTLYRPVFLLVMLVFFINQSYTQKQNKLVLLYLPKDSVIANTTVNKNLTSIIPLQADVRKYVAQYLNENSEILAKIKERNSAAFTTIQQILVKRGIPAGLMYLAIVESDLKNSATSPAGAAGIWQLMPETARTFGLQVNAKTDQRRHLAQSSVAVADYLNELYKQFDDWLLVVAAYNCGSGNVFKAIKLSGSREFWKMQRYLPTETSAHVKHFIATHYYYEQSGSLVTLTKKERTRYLASLNEMVAKNEKAKQGDCPDTGNQTANGALFYEHKGGLIVEWKK